MGHCQNQEIDIGRLLLTQLQTLLRYPVLSSVPGSNHIPLRLEPF